MAKLGAYMAEQEFIWAARIEQVAGIIMLDRNTFLSFEIPKWEQSMSDDKIEIENVNSPGRVERVNRAKYEAMHRALLAVLPNEAPGMKVPDAKAALLPNLPDDLFPQGETAGWWLKAVQLDLEAKNVIKRAPRSPVQLYKLT